MRRTPDQRFENLYIPEPNTGCFLWIGGLAKGYGRFSVGGHTGRASHYAWERVNGPVPRGMWVCHKCDNPPCVNPAHLFIGTASDNQRDSVAKGRHCSSSKKACPRGHAYTEGNTTINSEGRRVCRTCSRIKDANRSEEQRARQNAARKRRHHAAAQFAALAARGGDDGK